MSAEERSLRTMVAGAAGGLHALGAYGLWGILPVYWKWLGAVDSVEVACARVVFSALFTGGLVLLLRRAAEVRATLRSPRHALPLLASGTLIAANWCIFIWSIAHARLVEASFGYYLNPLVNVGFGVLLLGERLSRVQAIAIGVAALGVAVLGTEQGGAVWISLSLALSFGAYGLVHKLTPASSVTGLFLETAFVAPIALAYLGWRARHGESGLLHGDLVTQLLLVSTGVVTAVPLVLFASAARRLRLSTLGLFQYLSPSLSFLLAILAYGEPFGTARALAFALIWVAVALYSFGSLQGAARDWVAPEA